jgi:DNA helicase-2/ATP-dependent DNA helicase PcrA
MSVPLLAELDLEKLATDFPTLDFSDAERRAVLLEAGVRDVQAAPGSGKTTLLAAKLQLLADKWTHLNRGICVLSHTNVARDEISKRLSASSVGARLLAYPHYVGTIHAFVNQFLALPMLRSDGEIVDVVDNDIFASQALSLLRTKSTLNTWVRNNPQRGPAAIASLRYQGADLTLGYESGGLPKPGTVSWAEAQQLKEQLRTKGIFRFDDMFAFAEKLLVRFPDMPKRLSYRFPLVLVDEMQDTSWAQEDLLARLFDDTVIIQRYGDRNQRILSSGIDAGRLTFPKPESLSVTSTKRFPESIAAVVRTVQEYGEAVSAIAVADALPPVLFLYPTSQVTTVIEAFGKHVLASFSDAELARGDVKAICARKKSDSASAAGRHIGDYWPEYEGTNMSPSGSESVYRLLADPETMGIVPIGLDQRVRNIKRVLLIVLRAARAPSIKDIRDATHLLRILEIAGCDVEPIRMLCHKLATTTGNTSVARWESTLDTIYGALTALLPSTLTREAFAALSIFESTAIGPTSSVANIYVVNHEGRSVPVLVGTTASVKGETHLATLVLEAHAHPARSHDLQAALVSIAGGASLSVKATESTRSLFRNLYVAASRPSRLLCMAMNRERAPEPHVQALRDRGWMIVELDDESDNVASF